MLFSKFEEYVENVTEAKIGLEYIFQFHVEDL